MSVPSGSPKKWAIRVASGMIAIGPGVVVATVGPSTESASEQSSIAIPSTTVTRPSPTTTDNSLAVSESTTTSPVAPPNSNEVCGFDNEVKYFETILQHHGIVNPHLRTDTQSPGYLRGDITVEIRECEIKSVMAHESGHYIMDLAHGFQLEAHLQDVITNFCPGGALNGRCQGGWIQGDERFPGLEHAAHCIGNVLIGTTKYTKCPDEAMRALAAQRISQAAGVTH